MMTFREKLENYKQNLLRVRISRACKNEDEQINQMKNDIRLVNAVIDSLSENEQQLLDLRYRKGLSYAMVAKEVGYAKSTVVYKIERLISLLEHQIS